MISPISAGFAALVATHCCKYTGSISVKLSLKLSSNCHFHSVVNKLGSREFGKSCNETVSGVCLGTHSDTCEHPLRLIVVSPHCTWSSKQEMGFTNTDPRADLSTPFEFHNYKQSSSVLPPCGIEFLRNPTTRL